MLKGEKIKSGMVVLTDMKDYTVKSSLMTNMQLLKIIDEQEKIFNKNVIKYNGKMVKSMGDGYMIFFENSIEGLNAILNIQKDLGKYNETKKIPLFKIEVRIGVDYGKFIEKNTILGIDFFGNSVNIASRLEGLIVSNGIFFTENVLKNIGDDSKKYNFYKIGIKSLKGIFEDIEIYELLDGDINLENYKKNYIEENIENYSQEEVKKLFRNNITKGEKN